VPFIVSWKGKVTPGKINNALFSQIDLYASLASLAGVTVEEGQAPDSWNQLPVLLNEKSKPREFIVEQSLNNTLSLVIDNWKYIESSKGPKVNKDTNTELGNLPEPQLYNLTTDPGETKNLADMYQDKLHEMKAKLDKIKQN
jgi:arylsulfatase A-like enzyme